jgi:cobalt/nickel transport system permease protein
LTKKEIFLYTFPVSHEGIIILHEAVVKHGKRAFFSLLEVFMHMADALLSPAVGGTMLAVSAATIGLSVKKIGGERMDDQKIPLMGVMGAFVFAGQMINFTIPGTGSSGHICGGILLAALLGPAAAIITLAAVLLIQCLLFADGGLLAYGCNVFNMGVTSAIIAYTFIYKPITAKALNNKTITLGSILAAVIGLQIGAFGVVLETMFSGVTELPFGTFVLLMQPIHLAIGFVEGLITAAVLCFVHAARPSLLDAAGAQSSGEDKFSAKKILLVLGALALVVAGGLSLFASANPDGLEWSINKVTGSPELERESPAIKAAGSIVEKTALLPDYAFPEGDAPANEAAGTAFSGIVGSIITMLLAGALGFLIYAVRKRSREKTGRA